MSTTLSHTSCVCDTLNNSPVDQLFQRSTNWSALDTTSIPVVGRDSSTEVLSIESKRHLWPVYLVNVASEWSPGSWKSIPPYMQRFKSAETASNVARVLNQEILESSNNGFVTTWYIRVKFSAKNILANIQLSYPWKPSGPADMPPAFIKIDGPSEDCRQMLDELNSKFFSDPETKNKRAYIGRSIDPEILRPFPSGQNEPTEEKGDTVSPLNKTSDQSEEIDGPPELYEVHMGHTFDVNPSCGEEVLIQVYNTSDPEKARHKAERYLKQHAQDLLEWGQLDLTAAAADILHNHGLELRNANGNC